MSYNWECPYCGRRASLTTNSYCHDKDYVCTEELGKDGDLNYELAYVVCPNPDCKEYTLHINFYKRIEVQDGLGNRRYSNGDLLISYQLKPRGSAKPFPEYIPEPIREDYEEACLILHDSPKASATLSRRCLQGLIRDYYKISKDSLYHEIQALKEILPVDLWDAVDGIREVGNVAAHSEKDVNVIVDVPPESASALIKLIELLFHETYIKDNERKQRIGAAVTAANAVKLQKQSNTKEE